MAVIAPDFTTKVVLHKTSASFLFLRRRYGYGIVDGCASEWMKRKRAKVFHRPDLAPIHPTPTFIRFA
jgi:hypothetical protein